MQLIRANWDCSLCRELTRRRVVPNSAGLVHHSVGVPGKIKVLFGWEIEFDVMRDQLVLPSSVTTLGLANADPYLNSLLLRYCEEAHPSSALSLAIGERMSKTRSYSYFRTQLYDFFSPTVWGMAFSPGGRPG
jgi:hypothetical protein